MCLNVLRLNIWIVHKMEKDRCVVRIVLGRTDPYSKLTAGGVHTNKYEKNIRTIATVFPRGVQKEEIQQ